MQKQKSVIVIFLWETMMANTACHRVRFSCRVG